MDSYLGRCQCGATAYEMKRPVAAWICHCRDCQRMTSSAFSFSMATSSTGFRFLKGEPRRFEKTGDNGSKSDQLFCPGCGTWMATRSAQAPDAVIVRVGTLDQHLWIAPGSQSWTASALPWALIPGLRSFERDATPEQALEVMAEWQKAHEGR